MRVQVPSFTPTCVRLYGMTSRRTQTINRYLTPSFAVAVASVVGFAGTVIAAPDAGASRPRCIVNVTWQREGTSWKFLKCVDGFTQAERTGTMGACWMEYPTWSLYTGPESDCAYTASGGPL